jgi:hypothetical protein
MRKTIKVVELVELVNQRNRVSTCAAGIRAGWNAILEEVLHKTDGYNGYRYLSAGEVPKGQAPGILPEDTGFIFPDESRRNYFVKRG